MNRVSLMRNAAQPAVERREAAEAGEREGEEELVVTGHDVIGIVGSRVPES